MVVPEVRDCISVQAISLYTLLPCLTVWVPWGGAYCSSAVHIWHCRLKRMACACMHFRNIRSASLSSQELLRGCLPRQCDSSWGLTQRMSAGFVEDYAFTEFRDCGIACAWNPSGTCIAAGSQDGYVVVWDARAHRVCIHFPVSNFERGGLFGTCMHALHRGATWALHCEASSCKCDLYTLTMCMLCGGQAGSLRRYFCVVEVVRPNEWTDSRFYIVWRLREN